MSTTMMLPDKSKRHPVLTVHSSPPPAGTCYAVDNPTPLTEKAEG